MTDAPIKLTPIGYRLLSEATEVLWTTTFQQVRAEQELWATILTDKMFLLLLGGQIFACVERQDGIARISPTAWRPVTDWKRMLISGRAHDDFRWEPVRNSDLLLSDPDFATVAGLVRELPKGSFGGALRKAAKNSPTSKIVSLGARILRGDPNKPKAEIRNELLAAGLSITENSWERSLYSKCRIAAHLSAHGRRGRPPKKRGE